MPDLDALFNMFIDNSTLVGSLPHSDCSSSSQPLIQTSSDDDSLSSYSSNNSLNTRPASISSDALALKRERNRKAAERCRLKKLNTIAALQKECEQLRLERDMLLAEVKAYRASFHLQ